MIKKPGYLLLLITTGLLSFYFLIWEVNKKPLVLWDESRQAINAYEMFKSDDLTVSTYHNKRDLWNTKPHLLVAMQAAGFYISGPSILALRMPSALAAWATVLLVFIFIAGRVSVFAGFASSIFLLTCFGLTQEHVAATGDYDALLMLFVLCSAIAMFSFTETNSIKQLRLFFLFVVLAFFTKGVAILLWLPAWIVWLVIKKQLKPLLINRQFWYGLAGSLAIIIAYYGLQEYLSPGFIKQAWQNEISGRLLKPNEGHNTSWWFYFVEIYSYAFAYWWLVIPGLAAAIYSKKTRDLGFWTSVLAFTFLLFISIAKTRIYWYMAPVYPFLAIACGVGLRQLLILIKPLDNIGLLKPMLYISILTAISITPALRVFSYKNDMAPTNDPKKDMAITFRNIENGIYQWPKNCKLLSDGYEPIVEYYTLILKDKNIKIPAVKQSDVNTGDTLCIFTSDDKEFIARRFKTKALLLVPHSDCYVLVETK